MDIKSSASSQSWIYQIQHPQAIISRVEWRMIWIWDHKQDHSYQHARMHNSQTMIARVGWRMDIEPSAWSSPTCKNIQLTPYTCDHQYNHSHQYARIQNSHAMIANADWRMDMELSAWLESPIYQNQLTSYDCQSRLRMG